ncbi:cobaltochelatase subunit CobN [Dongia soli]|uniref:Cobaltochelatase subunit CobN n=1 Tax=Dongia soli TaxID=600628 RepID=A0ABU5EBW5_9PROT|nr:cobaltochelatase subunit CobN [Dongia soli]MDY0883873.1 cobaltochelatase subunit CobN [Dongia soli]
MHLLAAKPGVIADGSEAIDLGQTPGDIVVLSAADTELACLAAAQAEISRQDASTPSLRLASLLQLGHNLSIDTYVEDIIAHARLVVVRVLGGVRYWPYGIEQVTAICRQRGIALALLPGDDQPDPELSEQSTLPAEAVHRLWQYLVQGGVENARQLLAYGASLTGRESDWQEPRPLLRAGLYWPGRQILRLDDLQAVWKPQRPVGTIVFYRALLQAGNLAAIDALIAALQARGLNPLPIYATSLKEQVAADLIDGFYRAAAPSVTLNCTGFALSQPGARTARTPFDIADAPILQVVLSGDRLEDWRDGTRGLSPRDLAMQVALPEVDGRILSRAISFKTAARFDQATQCNIVVHAPVPDRVAAVAELAAAWTDLRATLPSGRRLALILANYPNRDGRIGNGVGLDTPAGTVAVLQALQAAGYAIADVPTDGNALLDRLLAGRTNAADSRTRPSEITLSLADYRQFFDALPPTTRETVAARWGEPSDDPFFADGFFHLPMIRLGAMLVGIQPARGYNIDPVKSYHDPDLVPPHGYFAFYAYLRRIAKVQAIVHMGKHGNLEWLPGKAIALSEACYPEAVFGQVPHLYPFIVNDPGEGTQAKRRTGAVIVDHLTPPLTRAESYGPLRDLELLVDEYYEASQLDPRRCRDLREQILDLARASGLAEDCGIGAGDDTDTALGKLDNHLCELKELQIRDGLHIFGRSPDGLQLTDLLVALTRLPRGRGEGGDQSLIRALAADLALGEEIDPLAVQMGEIWSGPRPAVLQRLLADSWRTAGDMVERLEILAQRLVAGEMQCDAGWLRTQAVLYFIATELRPMVEGCGASELGGLLKGLDGRFVAPGSSGAPTRGRLDVLPTGRNFYSVDTRAVPTPTAWALGWKSAGLVLARHRQEHGDWPQSFVLSAWGTANMRTGGDDLAQALALIGVRPIWDAGASGRVSGFEILPLSLLDRPRVDVTLRVSGFFRDAFPAQIDLFDSAVRAVAKLDEPDNLNPIAARFRRDRDQLIATGLTVGEAEQRAGYRVFGSKPGAYGAGLQALIDERGWSETGDLARAYLAWGSYAYGAGSEGKAERQMFETRLRQVDAVLHNQDNREHDLLDSDDYYQFEGGLAATVKHLTGRKAVVWHNDHSRPEAPRIRSLDEEIARVVRARVVNPKWIKGVMRHGYKGAFEMAATVDYLFAFAATADCVADHHFDAVFDAYLGDETVRDFIASNNPAALREIAERLLEAQERGLWKARSNTAFGQLGEWAGRSLAS